MERLDRECCTFGRMFGPEHDEKFLTLSVREALEYFATFRKKNERPVAKFMIERHRKCLGVFKAESSPELEKRVNGKIEALDKAVKDKQRQEAAELRREHEEKQRALTRETVAETLEMNSKDLQFEERAMQIVKFIDGGKWNNPGQLIMGLKVSWKVGDKYMVRLLDRVRAILVEGRGGVPFAREVSVQKTILIREKALDKEDWKGAIAAQKHLDQITGVLAPSSVQINQQINIATHPQFRTVLDRIFTEVAAELDDHPELLERIQHRLARCLASTQRPLLVETVQ